MRFGGGLAWADAPGRCLSHACIWPAACPPALCVTPVVPLVVLAQVRLAKEAQQCAYTAIECDPGSDVAHHLMGRWHYEMAQINVVLRTLVRIMYGTALAPGTRQDALASYRRAAQLAPGRLIHK